MTRLTDRQGDGEEGGTRVCPCVYSHVRHVRSHVCSVCCVCMTRACVCSRVLCA